MFLAVVVKRPFLKESITMTLRQIESEQMSKMLFNSLIPEKTRKMRPSVQKSMLRSP